MPHSVKSKNDINSIISSHVSSHQSYDSHLSKSTSPSTQDFTHSQNSIRTEVFNFHPSNPDVTHSSTDTYADSSEDLGVVDEEPPVYCIYPTFLELKSRVLTTELRATNPSNFAEHFPSSKILSICHDILSSDNHMNLRVDTEDINNRGMVQLFHLRIQDLQMRRFSLRRYERNSGREICKTARKHVAATPVFPRYVSTALAHMKFSSSPSNFLQKLRLDSNSHGEFSVSGPPSSLRSDSNLIATNIIRLEFSNYAQVEVKCRNGRRLGKRYEFEYWGHNYVWRRIGKREAKYKGISYHLNRVGHATVIANIVPDLQNQWQKYQERKAGNWVPPCGMWISEIEGCDVAE